MQLKSVVYAFAAVWLVLFATSFIVVAVVAPEGDDFARRLSRIAAFLTWQVSALVVAAMAAFVAQRAAARGAEQVKVVGYVPIALSVFVIVSFIGIVAYRIWVRPLLA